MNKVMTENTNQNRSRSVVESQINDNPIGELAEIRRNAERSIEDGAVTESYSLDLGQAHQLLNMALATEIVCILRYRHHQIIAQGINYIEIAKEFAEHAENEEKHMMMLAERIDQLGGDPDFNPASLIQRSAANYGQGRDLVSLIRENLVAERVVIDVYRKMIEWFGMHDTTTRKLLEKILADEEEHANDLANLLESATTH